MRTPFLALALWLCLFSPSIPAQQPAAPQEPGATAPPPSDEDLLAQLAGDSPSRLQALRYTGPKLWEAPAQFFPAMTACADDPDVRVRRAVVTQIGQYMVWSPAEDEPQDQRAIEFLLLQTHDEDYRVRYNCVYYGLSTIRDKSDAVIDRLLDIVLMKKRQEPLSVYGRVKWGCRAVAEKTGQRIQKRLDELDPNAASDARMLATLHYDLTGSFPQHLDRFNETGRYVLIFHVIPPFVPNDEREIEQRLRSRLGSDFPIEQLKIGLVKGDFAGALFVAGLHHYATAVDELSARKEFSVDYEFSLDDMAEDDQERFMRRLTSGFAQPSDAPAVSYAIPFRKLYEQLAREYVYFELKGIDWEAVGEEFLPRSEALKTRSQFCLLCQELVARLEDSHAYLFKGKTEPVSIPSPRWDPGFACLFDEQDRPVVYHVDADSPAEKAGLRVGMIVTQLNDHDIQDVIAEQMRLNKKYVGYSSERYLRYQTARWLGRQMERDSLVKIAIIDPHGDRQQYEMKATLGVRYLPRLPVPIAGIGDSANVSWTRLDDDIAYIYVRRIRAELPEQLDAAVAELHDCKGLVIDVRGNSGGGFDARRALRNFDPDDKEEPERPRFEGPIALLIDSRCISAGEGWASWFKARGRGKFFGEATAGASSRKKTIEILDGDFKVIFSVKAYRGFLDRPIERLGIEPDFPARQSASDLAKNTDTVLNAARRYLKALP